MLQSSSYETCKKGIEDYYGSISQRRPKIAEFGPSCTHLSQSSMRILWPFHQNTSYILEAEMLFLDNFCFNEIFTVSKRLRRHEKEYFHLLRDAGTALGLGSKTRQQCPKMHISHPPL